MTETDRKGRRGFAAMDRDRQRDLAAKGGRSVPPVKRSFSRDHALAAEAGRKGGGHAHGGARHAESKETAQDGARTPEDR